MATSLQYTPEKVRGLIANGTLVFPKKTVDPPENMKGKKREDFIRRMELTKLFFSKPDLSATQIGKLASENKIFPRPVHRALVNFHVGNAIEWMMTHGKFADTSVVKASRKVR